MTLNTQGTAIDVCPLSANLPKDKDVEREKSARRKADEPQKRSNTLRV